MKFLFAMLAWALMGTVLGVAIFLATVKGSPWLLIASVIGLVVAVAKIGCATH